MGLAEPVGPWARSTGQMRPAVVTGHVAFTLQVGKHCCRAYAFLFCFCFFNALKSFKTTTTIGHLYLKSGSVK